MLASCAGQESGFGGDPVSVQDEFHKHIIKKISFQDVILTDNFWRPKIEINRVAGIRHAL